MLLKEYQEEALFAVRRFHEECSNLGKASLAYTSVTEDLYGQPYTYQPFSEGHHVPYSCVRLPTGGGKTLLAAHSVAVMAESYCHTDAPLALWLVPSTKILDQTLKALKSKTHPYHRALRQGLGEVNVASVSEALGQDVGLDPSRPLVIVATIQSFRVTEKEGRKVYDENGFLTQFFDKVAPEAKTDLMRDTDGNVISSLANLIALRRPIVIVDEAHNSTTPLSYEVLRDLQPSTILEMTATPNKKSNVIYAASAAQLKAEDMVKIPIFLETSRDWKQLMSDSIGLLSRLHDASIQERAATQDYIRPIMLFQAERRSKKKETRDFEFIERTLREDFDVPEEQIAVSVGSRDDLAKVDIASSECPIRFIITQSKLKEGWDCPFAYVLVSLAEQQSKTAVEQILGRVLRMPGARRRDHEELNKSYAFIHSKSFHEAAQQLQDNLIRSGFAKYEAEKLIQQYGSTISLKTKDDRETVPVVLPKGLENKGVVVEEGGHTIVLGSFSEEEQQQIMTQYPEVQIRDAGEGLELVPKDEEGARLMRVPRLGIVRDSKLSEFTTGAFSTAAWNPADYGAVLKKDDFSVKHENVAQAGEIDVDEKERIQTRKLKSVQEQMLLVSTNEAWDAGHLSAWITRKISHRDVTPPVFRAWVAQIVERLLSDGVHIEYLVQHKYRLRDAVERLYHHYQAQHRATGWQACLTNEDLVVKDEFAFEFHEFGDYPYSRPYPGGYQWEKHLFEDVGDLKEEGEEFDCAVQIDSLDEVDFWIRNLERKPGAFYLQLPTHRFYPDFILKLKDGRIIVIEYKGEHLVTAEDARMKEIVGKAWADASDGRCGFAMVSDRNWEALRAAVQ